MAAFLIRKPQVCQRFGDIGASTAYDWCSKGLLTPPVKIGPRASAWPSNEIDAISDARISGKTDDEIRTLVRKLVAARGKAA